MTDLDVGEVFLRDTLARMRGVKRLGEGALRQLGPDDWHAVLGPGENSVAVLIQHLVGNMRSRWGGFPHGDGEAVSRDRDAEFEDAGLSREELWALWEEGWGLFLGVLERVDPADLTRTLTIRGEPHTVLSAVQRQVAHYSGHVYQLVLLARHRVGPGWQTLSIPRGRSAAFNAGMAGQHGPSRDE